MEQKTRTGNGNFDEQLENLGRRATEELDDARERIGELGERFVGFVRARPRTALVAAVACGFLIGRILRA
jgi:ElaB/YqjD/DUF883 family membrane-anchored ribosome-binding protein